jgi:hypothetical protein
MAGIFYHARKIEPQSREGAKEINQKERKIHEFSRFSLSLSKTTFAPLRLGGERPSPYPTLNFLPGWSGGMSSSSRPALYYNNPHTDINDLCGLCFLSMLSVLSFFKPYR